jgi:maleylpyruvate isomerase
VPARTDQVSDPELLKSLLLARRGQSYFSRKLNELSDDELQGASLLPGWNRTHVVAHVGYNARAIARLVEWARTGVETPMYDSNGQRAEEIEYGATLRPDALRNLSAHAAIHLNVEWRDLPEEGWMREVTTIQGRTVPVSETIWMRTREVWLHALDLDNGGRVEDFPADVTDLLLEDLVRVWRRKRSPDQPNIVLEPLDRSEVYRVRDDDAAGIVARGSAAQLVAWGTGRGSRGVLLADGSMAPAAPPWL